MSISYITIEDVQKQAGLSYAYIGKCLKSLKPIFEKFTTRGKNNRVLISSGAITIFVRIKELKNDGLSLPAIKERLEKDMESIKSEKTGRSKVVKTGVKSEKSIKAENGGLERKNEKLQDKLETEKDERIKDIVERDGKIQELTNQKAILDGALKLLPGGKTPEQLNREYEERQKQDIEVARIVGELKSIGLLNFLKRKRLMKRLEELTSKINPQPNSKTQN